MKKSAVPTILFTALLLTLSGMQSSGLRLFNWKVKEESSLPEVNADAVARQTMLETLVQKGSRLNALRFRSDAQVKLEDFLTGAFAADFRFCDRDQWRLINARQDQWGIRHYKLTQFREGVKVYGMTYLLHEKNGRIISANGSFLPCAELSAIPVVSHEEARSIAVHSVPGRQYAWEKPGMDSLLRAANDDPEANFYPEGELVWLPGSLLNPTRGKETSEKLTWHFKVYTLAPFEGHEVFVDAATGVVLASWALTPNCIPAQGTALYQSGSVDFCVSSVVGPNGAGYRLYDTDRNIRTLDNLGLDQSIVIADYFYPTLLWAPAQRTAVAAHWGMKETYDYFQSYQNWLHFDNKPGSPTWIWTNFGDEYSNARKTPLGIVAGNGDGVQFGPFVSLDIIAHEYTHGIIEHTSNLGFYNESGALNEGLADIFGVVVEMSTLGPNSNYLLGEKIHLADTLTGIRRIDFPNLQKLPDTYYGLYWQDFGNCSTADCFIHHNSTVIGRWFYLLVNGETGVSENNDFYQINGIGLNAAARLVFEVMTNYLPENADFADFREYLLLAADNLSGYDLSNIAQAFCAVGIGPCDLSELEDVDVTVSAPDGNFFEGDTIMVDWSGISLNEKVDIQISLDNGINYQLVVAGYPNTEHYEWIAPGFNSDLCRIRVRKADDPLVSGVSNIFAIKGCNLLAHFTLNDNSPCFGQTVIAANSQVLPGVNYAWAVDGLPAIASPGSLSISSLSGGAGHIISLIAERGGCRDTFDLELFVEPEPTAEFSYTVNNQFITVLAQNEKAKAVTFTLNGVPLQNQGASGFSFPVETPGNYTICLYVNDECSAGALPPVCKEVEVPATIICDSDAEQVSQFNNTSLISDVIDYGDSLILATTGGLVFYNKNTEAFSVVNNANSALPADHLGSVAVDRENEVIYATVTGCKGFVELVKPDFHPIFHSVLDLQGLNSNDIVKLKMGPDGKLYIISESNGIRVAERTNGLLHITHSITSAQGLPEGYKISDIEFSSENLMWIGTRGGGLAKVVNGAVEEILAFGGNIQNRYIQTMYADSSGVWFSTLGGGDTLRFWGNDLPLAFGYGLSNAPPVSIAKGLNGHIYFGVTLNNYILEFDGSNFSLFDGLASCCYSKGPVVKLLSDKTTGNFWVGLREKLVAWDGVEDWTYKNTSITPFISNNIQYIFADDEEVIVTANEGAYLYNGVSFDSIEIGSFLPYQPSSSYLWVFDFTSEMVKDHIGRKWAAVGFYDMALCFLDPDPQFGWSFIKKEDLPFQSPIKRLLYHNEKLYIATYQEGLFILDLSNYSFEHFYQANSPIWPTWDGEMAFDPQYRLWLSNKGVSGSGQDLLVFDGAIWTTLTVPNTTGVRNLAFTGSGTLFVSTSENKILQYDGSEWLEISDLNLAIAGNAVQINDVQISRNGDLMIGTTAPNPLLFKDGTFGLIISDTTGAIREVYNEFNSGLPSSNIKTIKQTSQGTIWVITDNGTGMIQPYIETITPDFAFEGTCSGIPIHFINKTAGGSGFNWTIAGQSVGVGKNLNYTFPAPGEYPVTLEAITPDGCTVSTTRIVKVNPSAASSAKDQDLSLCDNSATLTAPEGMDQYTWKFGTQTLGHTQTQAVTQSGAYLLEITDHCGNMATATFNVLLTTDCVWPGDVNKDNIVDIYDWALMGIAFGAFGPSRTDITTGWQGYPAQNWSGLLFQNINLKHFDANGDGRIDLADFEAILVNYERTHGNYPGAPIQVESPYAFIPLVEVDTALTHGDTLALRVVVLATHESGQELPLYAAAGKLHWDLQGVSPQDIRFSFENASFSDNQQTVITMARVYPERNEIPFAFTGLDHQNFPEVSVIGEAHFLVVDDVVGLGDTLALKFNIDGPQGLVNTGNFIPLGGVDRSYRFTAGELTKSTDPPGRPIDEPLFTVFPNPVSDRLNIIYELDAVREVTFTLFTAQGTEVWKETVRTGQHLQKSLPVSGLPPGLYLLSAETAIGNSVIRVIKI